MTDDERTEMKANRKARLDHALRSKEAAKAAASNAAYAAIVELFEAAEHRQLVRGNGHHMAQEVAAFAADLMGMRWRDDR